MTKLGANPEILVLARESRGITQEGLAKKIKINQSLLSKYENDIHEIPQQVVTDVAAVLNYPENLFYCTELNAMLGSSCLYHRKRKSLSVNELRRLQAMINLMRIRFKRLLRSCEIDTRYEFPYFSLTEYGAPERIAELTRQSWQLPMGPIKNLIAVIERAKGIVYPFHFGTQKLDAVSQYPDDMNPLFFINLDMPWDRIRFSLAHEIGHIIMHNSRVTDNQEEEANLFASAFLMPARDIMADLSDMSLQRAADLKIYWRVSMQALIMRAYNLDRISKIQYRRLFTELSKRGYRKKEPQMIVPEEPTIYSRLIDIHLESFGYSKKELSHMIYLDELEFENMYLSQKGSFITIAQ